MSEWLVLTIAMAVACVVVLSITVLRDRRVGADDDPSETPDVIEYMTMMIGVVYAIVLGLAIAGVWEARNTAQDAVRAEAQALHEVDERVQAYAPAVRDRTREDVDAYVSYVVHKEWPVMLRRGEITDRSGQLLDKVREDVTSYVPRNDHEAQSYQPLLDQVGAADAGRSARAQNADDTMPGVVWFGLIAGALVAVGLVFTLQIRRSPRELLLAGLYSALIAFLLFLIWDFNTPFGHDVADASEPFRRLFAI
ncbi:bestrophin-like domain [Streptomyces sp. NPDC002537]